MLMAETFLSKTILNSLVEAVKVALRTLILGRLSSRQVFFYSWKVKPGLHVRH